MSGNELTSSPQPKNENLNDDFTKTKISRFFQERMEELGLDLPSTWSLDDFLRMVLGEDEVLDPLSDVYSNLVECGFISCYWEEFFDFIQLVYGII
jgi:hypothetical protein